MTLSTQSPVVSCHHSATMPCAIAGACGAHHSPGNAAGLEGRPDLYPVGPPIPSKIVDGVE